MASITDVFTALQNGVTGINNLAQIISKIFPQTTASSTSAPATVGTITFTSSEAALFMLVQSSSGATYKIALYNQ